MNWLQDFFLPKSASNLAPDIDMAWNVILWVTTFFFVVVVGAMSFFVVRYRRRTPNDVTSTITHNTALEIIWTGIPLILVVIFFYVGFKGFMNYDNPPSNCVVVAVQAQQWKFNFVYPNGAEDDNLYLLKGQPVRLDMTSKDVLHALYIPEFRTQRNFVPGRLTNIWFIPTEFSPPESATSQPATASAPGTAPASTAASTTVTDPGGWPIFCTQYCGDGHSRMFARVFVLAPAEFDAKMKELANPFKEKINGKNRWRPYVKLGEKLYGQLGCSSCHSVDAAMSVGTGPPWRGLWKRDHEPFAASDEAGYTLKESDSDDKWIEYLKQSMLAPDAKLVTYQNKAFHGMPSFAAQLSGNVSNVEKQRALAEFIKSIGREPYTAPLPLDSPLYDADNPVLFDDDKQPVHPESLAGIKARQALTTQPGR